MQSSTPLLTRHCLAKTDKKSVNKLRQLLGEMVLESRHSSCRESHSMQWTVQSTKRRAW
jgi:hypothetical protein